MASPHLLQPLGQAEDCWARVRVRFAVYFYFHTALLAVRQGDVGMSHRQAINHLQLMNDLQLAVGVLIFQLLDSDLPLPKILASEKHRAGAAFSQLPLKPIDVVEDLGHG